MKRAALVFTLAILPLLGGCDAPWGDDGDRTTSARDFPPADRPVAPTVSTKWSTEEARDRVNEAEDVMDSADVRPGMTVADIGAGDGYYTVRLAQRVGANGKLSLIIFYTGRGVVGVPQRIHFTFAKDAAHLGNTSAWVKFRVTS